MIINKKKVRVNSEVTAPKVRLVNSQGEQEGVVPNEKAQESAQEAELDLVEVSPHSDPPVCKVMDYGKYCFQQSKKQAAAKKKQKQIHIKEIKFRPVTDSGDFNVKVKKMIKFLEQGDKVKVAIRFRGREMAHQKLGKDLMERVKDAVADYANVDNQPKLEGRQMIMILSPLQK